MLVGFGQVHVYLASPVFFNESNPSNQVICLPVGPRCDSCELSTAGLCPSAQKNVKSKTRKTRSLVSLAFNSTSDLASPKIEIAVEEDVKPTFKDETPIMEHSADLYLMKDEESW